MTKTEFVDLTADGLTEGMLTFCPASEEYGPKGGFPFYGCGIAEQRYPNWLSSSSGHIVARTPFGEAVVEYKSFCGTAVFQPCDPRSAYARESAFALAKKRNVPVLELRHYDVSGRRYPHVILSNLSAN